MLLYGGGIQKLADALGKNFEEARALRLQYFKTLPAIASWNKRVMDQAFAYGKITNWLGRVCYFPDRNKVYTAPNHLIQGGCADIVKMAMVQIQ